MQTVIQLLQMRRERFTEELESYGKQLEEFQGFGDMADIQKYLKKAQALNQRLETALEKVALAKTYVSLCSLDCSKIFVLCFL